MRALTHPKQSAAITGLTLGPCLVYLLYSLTQSGLHRTQGSGLAIAAIFALLVWGMRSATGPAAIAGGILTATLYLGTCASSVDASSAPWWQNALPLLFVLLLLTLFATRFRKSRKEQLDLAESKAGRRASQVCANLGASALFAALSLSALPRIVLLLAITAAFVEAAADTVSSEIGQSMPGKTVLLTTGRAVPVGTDGGISLVGTVAGCVAGALVAAIGGICLGLAPEQSCLCWLAGIAGIFFDSWLGATLERQDVLGNDAVNFLSTIFSALLAVLFNAVGWR